MRSRAQKLFDRAPYALDLKKGDIAFTAMSNHFASQSHENACRIAEAESVRRQTVALQQAGKNVLVAGDLNDFEFSAALARLTQGNALTNLWVQRPAGLAYSYKFNGHLQTLDHILVTAGCSRASPTCATSTSTTTATSAPRPTPRHEPLADGTGISDHDPPLATFELPREHEDARQRHRHVPATLSLTLGTPPASLGPFAPGVAHGLHDVDGRDRHLDRRGRRAERARPELDRHRPLVNGALRAGLTRSRSTPTAARSRRCGPTTARSR